MLAPFGRARPPIEGREGGARPKAAIWRECRSRDMGAASAMVLPLSKKSSRAADEGLSGASRFSTAGPARAMEAPKKRPHPAACALLGRETGYLCQPVSAVPIMRLRMQCDSLTEHLLLCTRRRLLALVWREPIDSVA